jgi:hypothetical protein
VPRIRSMGSWSRGLWEDASLSKRRNGGQFGDDVKGVIPGGKSIRSGWVIPGRAAWWCPGAVSKTVGRWWLLKITRELSWTVVETRYPIRRYVDPGSTQRAGVVRERPEIQFPGSDSIIES